MLTAKLGHILTNKHRKTIKTELCRLETTRLTKTERERATTYFINLRKKLENKQKYHSSDHHDQNYYDIKDIEHLFNETVDDFDNNFEEYEIRGDKDKNLSLKEYQTSITSQLTKLINEKKNSTQK